MKVYMPVCATYTNEPIIVKLATNIIPSDIPSPQYYLNFRPFKLHVVSEKLKGCKNNDAI